jgi:hypothetical protein
MQLAANVVADKEAAELSDEVCDGGQRKMGPGGWSAHASDSDASDSDDAPFSAVNHVANGQDVSVPT